jgi:aspartyl-tRNA(Asn)/glutamyl-tRNA(Gln) amidotransferase subunit C
MSQPLSESDVRKVAALCRLSLTDEEVHAFRDRLGTVIGYVERLAELDLTGVDPLTHVGDLANRLRDDDPGPALPNEALMRMAPDPLPPFIRIPKVIGDGGGA